LKYNPDEARNLKSYGELPEHAKINDTVTFGDDEEDDNIIEFDDVNDDEDGNEDEDDIDINYV
jgi:translation initiation factor 1A